MSFLPERFAPKYKISPKYSKSAAYFCSEFAIDQTLKIYSGGLGFLAGSHMRSAHDLQQNMVGIGILWSYGYYHQGRADDREMCVQRRRNVYHFLQDPGIEYQIDIHGKQVWVKALFLPGEVFQTCPMFLLTTDIDKNDDEARSISHRLYDADGLIRIAQYMLLGVGGAKLLEHIDAEPEVYHLNEAHGLSAAFQVYSKTKSLDEVKKRFIFTTHTPEAAGNEVHEFDVLKNFNFFCGTPEDEVRQITGIHDNDFNHTLVGLRMSKYANGVSKLHGEVSRKMWGGYENICEITHVTNAQNKKYWVDADMEAARVKGSLRDLRERKRELKEKLFRIVADQTGRLFDPDVLTLVWARRFAGYKRADLIARQKERFEALLNNTKYPIQILWAGKPYPKDLGATDTFNNLIHATKDYSNATVLVGYELSLSKFLKDGSDVWLNNPVVTREASGTSGMTAAMNGSISLSTYDGWICEYAKDGENSFIVPPAPEDASEEARDLHDTNCLYHLLENKVLPLYYDKKDAWWKFVNTAMNDVAPFFDADRMAAEYYDKMYNAK